MRGLRLDRKRDLPQLFPGPEARLGGGRFRQRKLAVDHGAQAPLEDEPHDGGEIGAGPHARTQNRKMLPEDEAIVEFEVVAAAVAVGSGVFVGGIGVGEGATVGGTDVAATPQPDAVISSASASKTNPMDFFTI